LNVKFVYYYYKLFKLVTIRNFLIKHMHLTFDGSIAPSEAKKTVTNFEKKKP